MSNTPITDNIRKETKAELNASLNAFVRRALSDLPGQSPQYTGFLASSWTADTTRPQPTDSIEPPWTQVKSDLDRKLKRSPIIRPRYRSVPKFKFGQTIFVGNKAEYARYALGSDNSNILPYFEKLKDIAEIVFSRKPDLRIAATQVLPLGESPGREAPAQGSRYKKI